MSVTKASRLLAIQTIPRQSKSSSLQLLIANAYVQQLGQGLYSLLPLGQRVVSRIVSLVERELDAIDAQKVWLPAIGAKEIWEKTGRWDSMGKELFKFTDRKEFEYCLQPTAEEMMTSVVASHSSPPTTAFPLLLYQTTEKYRDEMSPRFGMIRGRSFLMNDLYSFDLTEESAKETYGRVCSAYDRIFKDRLKLDVYKVRADSGIHGGALSHEYHMKNALEEDAMEQCTSCGAHYKADEPASSEQCCAGAKRRRISSIEIAHTFQLGKRYSEAMNAYAGNRQHLEMCCFGIGVSRLLPAIVEWMARPHAELNDKKKPSTIYLPPVIQPFDVAVVVSNSLATSPLVHTVVEALKEGMRVGEDGEKVAILLDDRPEMSIGRRVKYAEQIGLSRVVVLGKGTESTKDTSPLFELWTSDPYKSESLSKRGDYGVAEIVQRLNE